MFTQRTSRITTAAIATVAGLAVLSPLAHAAEAAPAKPAQQTKLTVAGYTKYLKTAKTPEARQTLAKFSKLNKNQKVRFVKDLQDRKVYRALLGKVNRGVVGKNITTVDTYNKEVRFVTKAVSKVAKDTNRTTTVRFSVTETIYRIPVTTETITVKYVGGSKQGPRKVTGTTKVTNVNAAINITNQRVSVKGRGVQGQFAAKGQVKSFGKPAYKKASVLITGKTTYRASLANNG